VHVAPIGVLDVDGLHLPDTPLVPIRGAIRHVGDLYNGARRHKLTQLWLTDAWVRSVKALEQRIAPGNVLSEEQAAEVSDRVKTVAEALTARDVAAGAAPRNWYGSIYRALYKQYNVAGYRLIRQEQYADVLSWLGNFHEAARPTGQLDDDD